MNRLWVRLSLMIGGVLFFVFALQFVQLMTSDLSNSQPPTEFPPSTAEIAFRLVDFMGLSVVVGLGGGILISRAVSKPITEIAQAACRVGEGELEVRVPDRGSREMVELANSFNKMAADLQRAEKLRNDQIADVSHELRTPLTILEANLRAVLDHVYPLNEAEIANLYGQTHHLIRLVNDLRDLALAEDGNLPLEKQSTDMNALVSEVVLALEPLAEEKEVELVNNVVEFPTMSLDRVRIRQVLFNLISNALLHTPPAGTITIDGVCGTKEVRLSIQDTGDGLESEQLTSVFDRFYRVDKSRSRDTGGTGLGLSIVKAIIEAHGGNVKAFSSGKDQGCEFVINLPVDEE